MKLPTYEQYQTEAQKFRQSVTNYINSRDYNVEHKELSYHILDAIDLKSKTDPELMNDAFLYFTQQKGYSTIKLREICEKAGFSFGEARNNNKLDVSNAITTLDSANAHYENDEYKTVADTFTLQKLSLYKAVGDEIVFDGGYAYNERGINIDPNAPDARKMKVRKMTSVHINLTDFGFPNFASSGNAEGMRKIYGKGALMVEQDGYIYNVTGAPDIYYQHAIER